jgi:microcystin-dependent protein
MAKANSTPVPVGDFPIGTITTFAGILDSAALQSAGWLYCNGNTISRTDYADLFAVIGSANGDGDGISTFTLPDFRGTFIRGVDGATKHDPDAASRTAAAAGGNTGDSVGSVQGYAIGAPQTALTTNETGSHTHTANHIPTDNSSYAVAGSYQAIWNSGSGNTDSAGNHTHNVVGGGDKESRPVNVYSYYIIKFAQV